MHYSKTQSLNLHHSGRMLYFIPLMLVYALTMSAARGTVEEKPMNIEIATFAGGCFWCTEAVFQSVDGVKKVTSGYMGGHVENPTYEQVCSGATGHAEAIQIEFDPSVVSYRYLVDLFWQAHNPTTLNQQGADVGTQYRSAVFYHSDEQKAIVEASREAAQTGFKDPIVTEIAEAEPFYLAEDYHQDFYDNNKAYPYCRAVIKPKLHKLGIE